jgi:rhodanese-related sulfurtransferase
MKKFILITIAVLFLSGCGTEASREKSSDNEKNFVLKKQETGDDVKFNSITAGQAKELIASEDIYILDVRSEEGYSDGHIQNAKNIPLKGLEGRLSELEKNNKYLIVCKTGKTSEEASKLLVKNGYTNIYNLAGGMDNWTGDVVTE